MTPDQFLEEFGHFLEAPSGIEKLRETILLLGVSGRLAPQDPNDGSAKKLLDSWEGAKQNLNATKKVKLRKNVPPVDLSETPFSLPENWEWERLARVGYDLGQKKPDQEFCYIDVSAIDNKAGRISDAVDVIAADRAPSRARKIVRAGTVLYSTVRPYLRNIVIVDREFPFEPIASTAFAVIYPFEGLLSRFLHIWLRSAYFSEYVSGEMKGVAYPAINDQKFFRGLVPIPPSNEQVRIVAKVDELMALCEELEAERNQAAEILTSFQSAALNRLANADSAENLATAWQRVANNFSEVTCDLKGVKDLRKTILQLAIRGRLLPQNPSDTDAAELLASAMGSEDWPPKRSKKLSDTAGPIVTEDEKPSSLPDRWTWCRLGQLINVKSGSALTAARMKQQGRIPVFGGNGITGHHNEANITRPTIVIGRVGFYCGSVHITPIEAWVTDNALIVSFPEKVVGLRFLAMLLGATNLKERESATAQPVISATKIYSIPLPLPPPAEQHRIVAKVDQLMALCDELEAQINERDMIATAYPEAAAASFAA